MADRPRDFRINYGHQLADGLVFAGLGRHSLSTYYHDSSHYSNHGILTNMDPTTDWVWSNELGRWALTKTTAVSKGVDVPTTMFSLGASDITVAAWINSSSLTYQDECCIYGATETAIKLRADGDAIWYRIAGTTNQQTGLSWSSLGWFHVAMRRIGTTAQAFFNGSPVGSTWTASGSISATSFVAAWENNSEYGLIGSICDWFIASRGCSDSEIAILADRSDPFLGGLVLPPRRRVFRSATVAAAAYTRRIFPGATATGARIKVS